MGLVQFISMLFFISISSTCHCRRFTSFARQSTTHSNVATNGRVGVHDLDGAASYYRAGGREPDQTYGSATGGMADKLLTATRGSFDALSDANPIPMQTTGGLFNTQRVPSFNFDYALKNDENYYKYPTEGVGGPLNVVDFGAIGNGQADDTQAFLKAWQATCSSSNPNPTLVVPRGRTFLVTPITFSGPCKSPVLVQIYGNLVAPNSLDAWRNAGKDNWIVFLQVSGLTIDGGNSGQINGNGEVWWKYCNNQDCSRPAGLRLQGCNNFLLQRTKHINSGKGHIGINDCSNGTISGIAVFAPDDSPNTDGIDIAFSDHITIQQSSIGTGDDCVAINGGSSFITIKSIVCGPGHGISIGSLGKDGKFETVEAIKVQNSLFRRTQNGARIKTWQGGKGYARNIAFKNIELDTVNNPIIIDQYYCGGVHNCQNQTSSVAISDVFFTDIRGTAASENAIKLGCSLTGFGCKNIVLDKIKIMPVPTLKYVDVICTKVHGQFSDITPSVSNCFLQS